VACSNVPFVYPTKHYYYTASDVLDLWLAAQAEAGGAHSPHLCSVPGTHWGRAQGKNVWTAGPNTHHNCVVCPIHNLRRLNLTEDEAGLPLVDCVKHILSKFQF